MKTNEQTPDTFTQLTHARNELAEMERLVAKKREQIRALVARFSRELGAPEPAEEKKPKRARRASSQINVSATVLALVQRQSGLTVPQIMDKLGLRDNESAVRSALKKAKDKTITSVKGAWYPIAPNPPAKEKAPETAPQGLGYVPGEAGPFSGNA